MESAKRVIQKLEKEKCDIIVALTHMDWEEDKDLARSCPKISLILGGHNHNASTFFQGDVLIVKAGSNAEYLAKITLEVDLTTVGVNGSAVRTVEITPHFQLIPNKNFPADERVENVIKKYVNSVDPNKLLPIATLLTSLDSRSNIVRSGETGVANLLADASVEFFQDVSPHLAFISAGSIRGDKKYSILHPITLNDLEEEFPFANPLRLIELEGKDLKNLAEHALAKAENIIGCFPVVSKSVKITYDLKRDPLQRVVNFTINSEQIQDEKVYRLVTTAYLSNGGDGYYAMKAHRPFSHPLNDTKMVKVVEKYVRNHSEELCPVVEGRLQSL